MGIRYAGESVRSVPRSVLGSSLDDVTISRVRAASTGASTIADREAAAVAMQMVAKGDTEDSIEESGMVDEEVKSTSCSATPNIAARKLLKNVSSVCERML